jgi:hypothetical protein
MNRPLAFSRGGSVKICPFCAEEILDAAIKCKHCGEMLNRGGVAPKMDTAPAAPPGDSANAATSQPLVTHGGVRTHARVVGVALKIGILFVPYVFSWLTLRQGYSKRVRIVALGWCGWFVLSFIFAVATLKNSYAGTDEHQDAGSGITAPTASSTAFIHETCDQLSNAIGPGSTLSDLQKEELWKRFAGRAFEWRLRVTEVSSDMFGGYTVQFKCAYNSPSLIQDIQIKYPASQKADVLQLSKGVAYDIRGILRTQSTLLGMTADQLP